MARPSVQRMPILGRHRDYALMPAHQVDFTLGPAEPIEPDRVVSDPTLSPYCLEPDRREVVLVETPAAVDLTRFPFLFDAQFRHASHVVTVPWSELHRLAAALPPPRDRLTFIHSVGRCGSTLLSRVFATIPGASSLAEPDVVTQLTEWRFDPRCDTRELERLVASCVRLHTKAIPGIPRPTQVVMKFRAQCIEIADLLQRAFPEAHQLYVTRAPLDWLESAWNAFVVPNDMERPDIAALLEEAFSRVHPLIRSLRVAGRPMPIWKTWMLVWIANSQAHRRLCAAGMTFHEIDYRDLRHRPEDTLRALFAATGPACPDAAALAQCLARDSQEDSVVARHAIAPHRRGLPPEHRRAAAELLREHGHEPEPG